MVTLACTDNFRSGPDKTKATQFIPLEGFVSKTANGLGVYAHMAKGDLVGMGYAVRTNAFKNAQGEDEYRTVLAVQRWRASPSPPPVTAALPARLPPPLPSRLRASLTATWTRPSASKPNRPGCQAAGA